MALSAGCRVIVPDVEAYDAMMGTADLKNLLAHVEAMMRLSNCEAGEFYFPTDGSTRPIKVRTPLRLS
jgi:general stress protein 26